MGAEMQGSVGAEIFADEAIKCGECMCRGEATFEQQPHWVAFIAKGWLDADKDIAEMRAKDVDGLTVALLAAGGRAPLRLDLRQIFFAADMVIGTDARCDIGVCAKLCSIAMKQRVTQHINAFWYVNRVAVIAHTLHCCMERLEHREMCSRSGCASIWREVEQDDSNLARRLFGLAHADDASDARG